MLGGVRYTGQLFCRAWATIKERDMSAAIEVQGVSKRFGQFTALNQVSFTVQQGEFFALLGPNGAGKTTLISFGRFVTSRSRRAARDGARCGQ